MSYVSGLGSMDPSAVINRTLKEVHSWIEALADALPRYNYYEGPLQGKEIGDGGKAYVKVGPDKVEVDRETFDTLVVGERLRVRYTRRRKAINIDRIVYTEEGPPGAK